MDAAGAAEHARPAPDGGGVVLLPRGDVLAEALASGLRLLGWRPRLAVPGEHHPPTRRLVLVEDGSGRLPVAERGAAGHVVVVAGIAAVERAIDEVARGARPVNAELPYQYLLRVVHRALGAAPPTAVEQAGLLADLRARREEARRLRTLTEREAAVLAGIAAGHRAEHIARDLSVSVATVRSQIAAVLRKLDVRSQTAAAARAHRSGAELRTLDPTGFFHQNCG